MELPAGITVFERGWLSSNNILFTGSGTSALVDSGYATHASQTVALIERALGGRSLDLLISTHLHSDHCGGNAALQRRYPGARTAIPPGLSEHVRAWDPEALSHAPTGQTCEQFRMDALLFPGAEIELGEMLWQIHAAPGHDPHSVILFEPRHRILISADALWRNGFGIVFPELEGESAFSDVADTLDLIESLAPLVVIPGHGSVFTEVAESLSIARDRLDGFLSDPVRHARHAAKVLLKFKLLEWQRLPEAEFLRWALSTPYLELVRERYFAHLDAGDWLVSLVNELERSGALAREGDQICDA